MNLKTMIVAVTTPAASGGIASAIDVIFKSENWINRGRLAFPPSNAPRAQERKAQALCYP